MRTCAKPKRGERSQLYPQNPFVSSEMIHGPVFHVNIIAGGHVDEVHKDLRVSSAGEGGVDGYVVDDTNEVQ